MKREYAWLAVTALLLLLVHAVATRCEANRVEMETIRRKIETIEKAVDMKSQAALLLNQLKQVEKQKTESKPGSK